ncbi:ParB N-terminal domain-containing protein [Myxococcota bacterium]|nr:ParB N-terminal domain-containing protein [Myxococcota bacterium]
MARTDDPGRARGHRPTLKETVAARSRDIAGAARARTEHFGTPGPERAPASGSVGAAAPPWLVAAVSLLPSTLRETLRAALSAGPGAGTPPAVAEVAAAREQLRQQRDDLRHREAALDAARLDLARSERLVGDQRREIEARAEAAERALAEARRAAAEAAVERLVPLGRILVREADCPRPVRGVARLALNLRRFGQLTPVVVTPEGDALRLVTGFRRMAALRLAGMTHARVRVVPDLDARTAAALYVAENCLVDGVTSKAVAHLAAQLRDDAPPAFAEVLATVQADDEEVVEEIYLEDMAEEARHHLAEGAAWVAALRPHWAELEPEDRQPLVELLTYFARVSARLSAPRGATRP